MIRLSAVSAALLFSIFNAVASPRLAFERDNAIWIANADGSNPRKIAKGSGPDLSPDGSRVTFTVDASSKNDLTRRIAVADVASGKVKVFKEEIPSSNCQRGVFSPDGSKILFEIWSDADWHLGLINADGSGFRYFRKTVPKGNSFWSTCWAPDGQSIYAQNLDDICQFDLSGGEIKKWKVDSLFSNAGFSSGSTLAISPDGKKLLAEVEMQNEEANMPDWDGPPPALWIYDFATEKAERLTAKGVLASKPCWLNETEIIFNVHKAGAQQTAIYRMNLGTKARKLLVKNGLNASASRQ